MPKDKLNNQSHNCTDEFMNIIKHQPELLAPAGSFESAVYAFKYGADAVYAGLQSFSARKGADNFTISQLRRLKTIAFENKRKIYITFNTVLLEKEFEAIYQKLHQLMHIGIDGIIIQDFGLLKVLKSSFPKIPIHASTQMGIHNAAGVKKALELGIRRIVLSRELTFNEISALTCEFNEMEFELFIHGALCYGFSGLCLASGMLLNRSGNRGQCAQICRTWFSEGNKNRYYFSCNDLGLKQQIIRFKEIGITSFKIEGRMKSPEYTGTTVQYYRKILDGTASREELENYLELSALSFSRKTTTAFFRSIDGKSENLINKDYPSFTGIPAGKVISRSSNGFKMKPKIKIEGRDGIMYLKPGNPSEPVHISLKNRMDKYGILKVNCSNPPPVGTMIFKTSSHDLHWPKINESSYALWRKPILINITLTNTEIIIVTNILNSKIEFSGKVSLERAQKKRYFVRILEILFNRSGDSWFTAGKLGFLNKSGYNDDEIFIRPSELKRIKNNFYKKIENWKDTITTKRIFISGSEEACAIPTIPERHLLSPSNGNAIPFITSFQKLTPEELFSADNYYFLPLNPVLFDSKSYFNKLSEFLSKNSNLKFLIGLNNIAHFSFVEDLKRFNNVQFFIDYGLYCANKFAYTFYKEIIPRLVFQYFWIEGSMENYMDMGKLPALHHIGKEFKPPLFISRSCFIKDSLMQECSKSCLKHKQFSLKQRSSFFQILVEDCLTYLFKT